MHSDIGAGRFTGNSALENAEELRGVIAAAAAGIAVCTPFGRYLGANPAWCRMLGYAESELLGREFDSLAHPDEVAQNRKLREELAGGRRASLPLEGRYLNKEGEVLWMRLNASCMRAPAGRVTKLVYVGEDITPRKRKALYSVGGKADERERAELASDATERKRVESRYRRLVDSSVQSVMFWNRRGEVIGGNDAFLRLTGYSREDLESGLIGWAAMTPPEYADLDRRALEEIAERGICTAYEKEWIRKDGSRIPILIGAAIFEDDPEEGVCFTLDLTQRVQSETSRSNEKRIQTLLEQTAVGVARIDALSGRYLHVNQRFCEILGRSAEELLQLTAAEIIHPESVGHDTELVREVRTGAMREFGVEKRYLRKDGSEVWVHVTVSEMWAPGAAPDYFLAVMQDISEHKQLEDHFRQAQKMQALGTLAGGIAHDFNNILASITGFAALAQLKLEGNGEVRDHLESVLTAGSRAAALVRQILAFSRQEHLERTPIQLDPILAESIQMLRSTIPSSIDIVASLAADAPMVLADASQISQILMNLGTNAWHAMKDRRGSIEFTLERCVVDAALAATQPRLRPGLHARISVRDSGCGMSAATLQRIFEPFFTTKPPGEGTGLGLAVVHGIVEGHDGAVSVHSRPGEGTAFHLYFPAHAPATGTAAIAQGPVPVRRGLGERILLVDDDDLLAELGRATLAALGYLVEVTSQPEAALDRVRTNPEQFRLVLTDQTMPTMSGLELAVELRKIRPDLPIILMTGYSVSLTPQAIEAVGIRQLLMKPASLRALADAVHAALSVADAGVERPVERRA